MIKDAVKCPLAGPILTPLVHREVKDDERLALFLPSPIGYGNPWDRGRSHFGDSLRGWC
jgi:hypothetical protein